MRQYILRRGGEDASGLGVVVAEEVALSGDGYAEEDDGEGKEWDRGECYGTETLDLHSHQPPSRSPLHAGRTYSGMRIPYPVSLIHRNPLEQRGTLVALILRRHGAALLVHHQPTPTLYIYNGTYSLSLSSSQSRRC